MTECICTLYAQTILDYFRQMMGDISTGFQRALPQLCRRPVDVHGRIFDSFASEHCLPSLPPLGCGQACTHRRALQKSTFCTHGDHCEYLDGPSLVRF